MGEVGQAFPAQIDEVRVGIDVDPAQAHRRAALGFLDGEVHVPPGQQRHREEPAVRIGLHFRDGIVVDLHAGEAQVGIDLGGGLAAESEDVGIDDLGVDAGLIHHLQPLLER